MCRASFFSTSAMPSSAITEIAWEVWKPLTSLIRSITGSWALMIQYLSGDEANFTKRFGEGILLSSQRTKSSRSGELGRRARPRAQQVGHAELGDDRERLRRCRHGAHCGGLA